MEEKKVAFIQNMIYGVRDQKVMLDSDLADLYGVEVKVLNQAVKRNIERFPRDFMFQLTQNEWENLRSQIVTSSYNYGGRRYVPYVFTEQGVSMLSSVIKSKQAIEVNINIMRAFVKLRYLLYSQAGTNEQIAELRKLLMLHIENNNCRFMRYDESIGKIIKALNNLIEKPKEPIKIGFNV
ncbi:MAG: ORF6N domain-containing protein [Treponema sp.]|nr:ORF6N domain-containing protein [Treponema sp.]